MIDTVFKAFTRIFGSRNDRALKRLDPIVARINDCEESCRALDDARFPERTAELRQRIAAGETLDDILVEAFALVREASRRTVGLRHYDVQMVGAIVLHRGNIAEMMTGEGKTLVATCPAYLNALGGGGVHVITVNDYLASRDAEWMSPIYSLLGLKIGVIQSDMDNAARREAYAADITYGTNNEFGFDYLRDNMKSRLEDQVQRRNFAILDEVDNILIDEARTPLIISGPSEGNIGKYARADDVARRLKQDTHFEVKEKESQAILTEEGIEAAQEMVGVESFYHGKNMEWPHLLEQALRAHYLFKRDVDYVLDAGESGQREVIIVDEFTGRLMPGRRWSDGLHQAVEAKERIGIRAENQTLATITFQNFFKLYDKLAGMTGTALTEAGEFLKIYGLDVMVIPTNRPLVRLDENDRIYANEKDKFTAVIDDIVESFKAGRPVLVGTTSIEKSERISDVLKRRGIDHEVLNAKQHAREAEIIAKAGQPSRVTIATNMAGRGTDIKLGEGVTGSGGLHIIGTERHEARRIDNQLRGRSGRQGDPGVSRFFLSLEDDLMRKFAGPRVKELLSKLGLKDGQAIEHKWVTNAVERAQKKVEERNFEIRKRLLEYDEVMNEQRTLIYGYRQQILRGEDLGDLGLRMFRQSIDRMLDATMPSKAARDDWDLTATGEWFRRKTGQEPPALDDLDRDALRETFLSLIGSQRAERAERIGPQMNEAVERYILLNAFDTKWKDHLANMDALKSGIGLRAYGNEDPKVAYKSEGYKLFEEMLRGLEEEVTDFLLRIEVNAPEEAKELEQAPDVWGGQEAHHGSLPGGREDMEAAAFRSQSQEAPKPFVRKEDKVGRNEPCPCGSGKKYKRCCGMTATT